VCVAIGGSGVIKCFGNCLGLSVFFVAEDVINWLWEFCWRECSHSWGWCDQMILGAVLVGVLLLLGLV